MPSKDQEHLGPILAAAGLRWSRTSPWALTQDEQFDFIATSPRYYQALDQSRRLELKQMTSDGSAFRDLKEKARHAYDFFPISNFTAAQWHQALGLRWNESHHDSELASDGKAIAEIRTLLYKARVHGGLLRYDLEDLRDWCRAQNNSGYPGWKKQGQVLPLILHELGILRGKPPAMAE